jgi:NAD(P)-dependent dehydrogenase (short-subunit alcohol dehydrogenase family)
MKENPDERPIAVVTGASAGVGRATVRALAAKGFDVGLLARGPDGLVAARDDVVAMGRRALPLSVDVADADAVTSAANHIERQLGPIDVWINNAMTSVVGPFERIGPDEFERVTQVTYLGVVNGTRAALAHMRQRGRGKIIQVGSALAYRSIPLQSAYCGSKAAIRGFTDSIRCELRHDRSPIQITMVQLPALNTPQFGWVRSRLPRHPRPVPPVFQPEVAARAIVWAATHRRREIYVGWSTIKAIVLGAKLFPAVADVYLARTGYVSQQTKEPGCEHPDNLFAAVAGDHGAHGVFERGAKATSLELSLSLHKGALALASGVALASATAAGAVGLVANRMFG